MRYLLSSVLILCLTLPLAGCSEAETEPQSNADAWTVAEDEIQLEEDLFLSETEDFFFGSIAELSVASDGRIFVLDRSENHVKVLSPEGELLQTVGRPGEGPGEFRSPMALALGRSDSLFVWDVGDRVSAFDTETYDFAYSIQAEKPERYQLRSRWMTRSLGLFVPEDEGLVAVFRPNFADEGSAQVHRLQQDGSLTEPPLATTSIGEFLVYEPHPGAVAGWTRKPFGRQPAFAMGPEGRIYHGWSDSLGVAIHDATDGQLHDYWTVPYEPAPVTRAEADEALPEAEHYREMIQDEGLANTRPAFDYFLVDDRRRVWFKRPSNDPDRADWWIADPAEGRVTTTTLPAGVHLRAIQRGLAYGQTTAEDGAPAVVRYRIAE